MRKEFSTAIERTAKQNPKIIFLTGDLGFHALENIQSVLGERFINAGVSEQNMISMAAGLAAEGFTPICYSIAPFAVFRAAEQTRVDVALHNLNVKIVGNGGGYGYGILGATHHAIEDIAFMSSLQNMRCYIPFCNEDVDGAITKMLTQKGPSYLRLGLGLKPPYLHIPKFAPTRKLLNGSKITLVAMGPVVLNAFQALEKIGDKNLVDLFIVSEMPLLNMSPALKESIRTTKKVVVLEEHVSRGGVAENLALLMQKEGLACRFTSVCAQGYRNGLYGSQTYHQKINGLGPDAIVEALKKQI